MTTWQHVSVITVDGPSGVGKGTVGKALALELGFHFLDSGALYRLLALAAIKQQVQFDNEQALIQLAENLDVAFDVDQATETTGIFLEGEDVAAKIRSQECGEAASVVSALAGVRTALLQRQRDFAVLPGLVADGRDMGTIVFSEAQLKFYLTADSNERARRRYNQLIKKGINVTLAAILQEIEERDQRDQNRKVAPLRPADDARIIDTTTMSVEQVLREVLTITREELS